MLKFTRSERFRAALYALVLLWINLYLCRELFFNQTAHMNSVQGLWIAMARLGGDSWFRAQWWPYWDCGIPFEFTYAPLIPWSTAMLVTLRGIPHALALQSVLGLVYCALPLTLFLMAWVLTRAPGCSFLAALLYSLAAPTQLIVPDGDFALVHFWDARRLYLTVVWDEAPHLAALALLPLVILFLSLSIQHRRVTYCVASIISIALAAMASAFGPVMVAMAALCLLFVLRRKTYLGNIGLTLSIGAFAYAISAPFLAPSIIQAIHHASRNGEPGWSAGSVTALAMVVLGWTVLWRYLPRWTTDWQLQFFALFAYLTSSIPIIATYFHRQVLPQPNRYKNEMELALALLLVFTARAWLAYVPRTIKVALLFLFIALAGEQVVTHRRFAKDVLFPADVTHTIEYRASRWAEENLGGVRVMMPGSIAMWTNAFTEVQQFSGSSWSMAFNQVQQRGLTAIHADPQKAVTWLKAYGVGAIAVSGPNSKEAWKPFANPDAFEKFFSVLWREDDVTIYRVPQRTPSLAHVIPESAVASGASIEQYTAALDDPALPLAQFEWQGRNRIHIGTSVASGQVISVQVSFHPGWHASVNGQARPIERDNLGLMRIKPQCNGRCDVDLEYDGGWELRLCRYLSFAAVAGCLSGAGLYPARRFLIGAS